MDGAFNMVSKIVINDLIAKITRLASGRKIAVTAAFVGNAAETSALPVASRINPTTTEGTTMSA